MGHNYINHIHPITGDLIRELTYSPKDFEMAKEFIQENYHKDFTLSFFDSLTGQTFEVTNSVSEILNEVPSILAYISSMEHTFVNWIGINSLSDSYVISIDITKGRDVLVVGHSYNYNLTTKKFELVM